MLSDSKLEKYLRLFTLKKYHYIILGIFLGLCLVYLIRSCTLSYSETYYRIGQDQRWVSLNLMGKERKFSAFNNELVTAIAKHEHFYTHIVLTPNPLLE